MIYKNALITTKDEQFLGWIEIDENKILKTIGKGQTDKKGIDCKNKILIPGFIDSHTHGGYGFSFDQLEDKNLIKNYLEKLKLEGIVGVVGTSVTSSLEQLEKQTHFIKKILEQKISELPKVVAWYFEGPFISKAKKGAHEEKLIIPMDEKFLNNIKKELGNHQIIFTFDAQEKINQELVKKYQNDFIFALGHSNANYEEAKKVLFNGTKRITHLYNAMSGFNHSSNTGIINTIFNKEFNNDLCIELIADGVHVSDQVIKYTYNNFDINNITLITDSLSPKGLDDGKYKLGNLDIDKRGNWFYLKDSQTLSGSAVKFNLLLSHFKKVTNCSWQDIVKVSSFNSARNLKLPLNYGDFVVGFPINFNLIDDNFNIIETYI